MERFSAHFLARLVIALVALPGAVSEALAQVPSPENDATAAAQYERGLQAMMAGDLDVGCPALAESVRLAPRPGAIFTLAECEGGWGRLASAHAHYEDYLNRYAQMTAEQRQQQQERFAIASRRVAELKPRLPHLLVALPPGAPPDVVVRRDGTVLGSPSLGVFLPVDPGPHELVAELGGATTRQTVTVAEAARTRAVLALPVTPDDGASRRDRTSPPYLAYGALGLGAIGVGLGTVFGLQAMGKTSAIDDHCAGVRCDAAGKAAADDAKRSALVSTVGFVAGGLALAAGILLLATHGAGPRARSSRVGRLPTAWGIRFFPEVQ